jgi:hypothetical protein
LSLLAKTLIEKRGHLDDEDIDRFIAAGFGKELALEVIAIVAASTITNYVGSVAGTPLEPHASARLRRGADRAARQVNDRDPSAGLRDVQAGEALA